MGKGKLVAVVSIIIVSFVSVSLIPVFAQSSEESLGFSVLNVTSYILTAFIVLIIPILIILLVLKIKGRLTSSMLKKILAGIGLSLLGLIILGITSSSFMSDEEKAERATEREERERQEQLEIQKQLAEQEQQEAAQIKESKSVELTDRQVADLVKQYKGKDGKGDRLVDVLATLITIAYPNEQILDNPSSVVDWYAFPDLTKREGIYKVGFIFETYKEDTEYIWYVDTNTNRISAGNSGAKAILDTLDAFD